MENLVQQKINSIFKHKGNIGPIAEKSNRNLQIISLNEVNKKGRLYYYIVGHAFKNIDKSIFEYQFDEDKKTVVPSKFLKLQLEYFTFEDQFKKTIENIRNVNSHYIHTLDDINCIKIDNAFLEFLKEAFLFSVISIYLKEKKLTYEQFKSDVSSKLINFLCDKFFPNEEHQKKEREHFLRLSLEQAIDYLLFIEVSEDFDWLMDDEHKIFTVKEGTYLSFNAQLFILALSLYTHEANLLISKIQGFKMSEDNFHYKRDIFTFFSKKISSQDIHSEEKNLIRFRDIIHYLNKYPTEWNKHLEPEGDCESMTNQLEKTVIEKEIFRSFPKYANTDKRDSFLKYSINQLFKEKEKLFDINNDKITANDLKEFKYEIENSPEVKNIDLELQRCSDDKKRGKLQFKRKKNIDKGNQIKEKLQKRVAQDILLKSYGRNQDRFMQIALRFLAEENYFGKDACFKMYQFYTTDEQNKFIAEQEIKLSKKEFDKFKYHQGKLVHFSTYEDHLKNYPAWDMPFVIENNAVQIRIKISYEEFELVSIQRALLPYFLENALYSKEEIADRGKDLLKSYFNSYLMEDFKNVTSNLSSDAISPLHRKLLPSRYLQQYYTVEKTEENVLKAHPYQKILDQAKKDEKRYLLLLSRAEKLGLKEEFTKKNKGKQFKLRFVKKIWHLLFFRPIYDQRFEEQGHHKSFNITKDEFNNFSKWMFAFDEIPQYKIYLEELFRSKNFFTNDDFKQIFEEGHSLSDYYERTKVFFEKWINTNPLNQIERKNNYSQILEKKIVYINLSHFIGFLEKVNRLQRDDNHQIIFKSEENTIYLISEWYYKDVLPREEYKVNAKLFNKLRKIKLEDALLYELGIRYLYTDKTIVKSAKANVDSILDSTVSFDVKDSSGKFLYKLLVPFNKLETLAVLIKHKREQIKTRKTNGTSFLTNLDPFIECIKDKDKNIKSIQENFKKKKELSFDDLTKINNYIISGSVVFSKVYMELERYFISKFKTQIHTNNNRIDIDDIKDIEGRTVFEQIYDKTKSVRKKAYHFGVPQKSYKEVLLKMEKKFIEDEINPLDISSFDELDKNKKTICRLFMNNLHNNLYKRMRNRNIEENKKAFEASYFKLVITNE